MANPIGLTMPLARTTSSLGYLDFTTTEIDATLANLKSLILTNWGERPNHYYMGCNLVEFMFGPADDETLASIIQRVEGQVAQWLPYVLLNNVSVTYEGAEGNIIKIIVDFSLRGRQDMSSVLEVSVPLGA